jgi:hypothetical protein
MSKKRQLLFRLCFLAALLSLYPAFVLGFTWIHVLRSEFQGGRHGMLDAYRHALASAVVSYTIGEWPVDLMTRLMERNHQASHEMDRHNNRIGARIGSSVQAFGQIEPAVRLAARDGAVDAKDGDQIRWLPKPEWRERKLW